jgi:hypothetical protein
MRLNHIFFAALQLALAVRAANIINCNCDPAIAAVKGYDCDKGCGQDCLVQATASHIKRINCDKSSVRCLVMN